MGAPLWLAKARRPPPGLGHFNQMIQVLEKYPFEEQRGTRGSGASRSRMCLITPWNWPINQIACKVAPALARAARWCEAHRIAPLNAILFAEVLHAAGVPAGVFNLVNGDGPTWDRRSPSTPAWTWCRSRAPRARASRWRARPRRP